jgi:pyruvate dehydrogenase E1 component beta subunit
MINRQLKFSEAIHEAIDVCLERDRKVYLMGLGVPDPIGVFGTTKGLQEKHGKKRVFDMPVAENAMSGVALGSCLVGMRPIMTHMRLEFAMTAMDQICNQAAKWHYMFGGQSKVPLTIRMLVGRGWGQGPQHSQSLHAWFAHIPGLKVVMPSTPYDAKGLLIASIEDDNPVVFFEHRWLHNIHGPVPEGHYTVPLGEPRLVTEGGDVTIVPLPTPPWSRSRPRVSSSGKASRPRSSICERWSRAMTPRSLPRCTRPAGWWSWTRAH